MASKAKGNIYIKLVSQAINPATGRKTGYFYVTKKNPKNSTEKFEFRKYDPVVRQHAIFKEEKMK
ncbi:MAG: 50S ribosomal protein L33 [Pseudomonadaceae bacterium]|nr:50S ribosomal protein L33 [Pseudomonadaceae bacterium]